MKYCKKCVLPDTRPTVSLDEEGICVSIRHVEVSKEESKLIGMLEWGNSEKSAEPVYHISQRACLTLESV